MTETRRKILFYGFGNPAREDDAIGPLLADRVEKLGLADITVDSDYQLTVEDAADVAAHDVVVFADASVEGDESFTFTRLQPERQESFSSHSVSPQGVLGLARDLFGAESEAWMLAVRGISFAMFTETMTQQAEDNLEKAFAFIVPMLESGTFGRAVCEQELHTQG